MSAGASFDIESDSDDETPRVVVQEVTEEVVAAEEAKKQATLGECVSLLKGPSDERRLAGLLLVTRLLSADDEETRKARGWGTHSNAFTRFTAAFDTLTPPPPVCAQTVAEALGSTFLQRLLSTGADGGAEALQTQGTALACAVASSLFRSPHVAASAQFYAQLLEPLVAVARQPRGGALEVAVDDAIEALAAVATTSPEGAHRVLLARGDLAATAVMAGPRGATMPLLAILTATLPLHNQEDCITTQAHDLVPVLPTVCRSIMESVNQDAALALQAAHVANQLLFTLALASAQDRRIAEQLASLGKWPHDLGRGLSMLLRVRNVAATTRCDCLVAAWGAASLLGPEWIACLGGDLMAPLVQVVVVEITVALHGIVRAPPGNNAAAASSGTPLLLLLELYRFCILALATSMEGSSQSPHEIPFNVAKHVARTLGTLAETLLEFLDEVTAPPAAQAADETTGAPHIHLPWDDDLVNAALCSVACFLGDVPVATAAYDGLIRIMPRLLAASALDGPSPPSSPPVLHVLLPLHSIMLTEQASSAVDALVPMRFVPVLCSIIKAATAAQSADEGGNEKAVWMANPAFRIMVVRHSFMLLWHVGKRATRERNAGSDPQAVDAAEELAQHVPHALASAVHWTPPLCDDDEEVEFLTMLQRLKSRAMHVQTAVDITSLLDELFVI